MKIEKLKEELEKLAEEEGLSTKEELNTEQGTRIDFALKREGKNFVAIEFENTYKWIRQRLLYEGVKAKKAGFEKILFVYPFHKGKESLRNSWVMEYIREDLGMKAKLAHPSKMLEALYDLI